MNSRILQITQVSGLPLRLDGKLLSRRTREGCGFSPAVFCADDQSSNCFTLQLQVPSAEGSSCRIRGRHSETGITIFESSALFMTGTGEQAATTVAVRLAYPVEGFLAVVGDFVWEVVCGDGIEEAGRGSLELYWVPQPPPGANRGVPLEALRHVSEILRSDARLELDLSSSKLRMLSQSPLDTLAALARNIFFTNPPIYDTVAGAPHFTSSDFNCITLNYSLYTESQSIAGFTCNCYDTAAILQYQTQLATSLFMQFSFLNPFGYLIQTFVMGVTTSSKSPISCNNPFFNNPDYNPSVLCPETDPKRSLFGNHAWVNIPYSGVVADACSGPHTGTETPAQYIEACIDTIYPNQKTSFTPGTVAGIVNYNGVTAVNTNVFEASFPRDINNLLEFVRNIDYDNRSALQPSVRVAVPESLLEHAELGSEWLFDEGELLGGYPLVGKRWVATRDQSFVELNLAVSSDGAMSAHQHFLALGSTHMFPGCPYTKGQVKLADAAAEGLGKDSGRILWVYRNFAFDLRGYNVTPNGLRSVADALNSVFVQRTEELGSSHLPKLNGTTQSGAVEQGDLIEISADIAPENLLFWDGTHPGLQIVEEGGFSFTFRATHKSHNHLKLYVVSPTDLLSSKMEVVLQVV